MDQIDDTIGPKLEHELLNEGDSQNGNGQKRRFLRQPIPKKVKRLRRNRRLRKILTPKNALMSLHELLGPGLSDFSILPEERGFVATVFVNNVQYEGRGEMISDFLLKNIFVFSFKEMRKFQPFFYSFLGPSKMSAKNSASEKALRDIIIQRMLQSPKAQPLKAGSDTASQGNPGTNNAL